MASYKGIFDDFKWTHPLAEVLGKSTPLVDMTETLGVWKTALDMANQSFKIPGEEIRSLYEKEQEMLHLTTFSKLIEQEQSVANALKGVLPLDTPITKVSEQLAAISKNFSVYNEFKNVFQNPISAMLSGYERTISNRYSKILSGININSNLSMIDATAGFVNRQAEWMGSLFDTVSDEEYLLSEDEKEKYKYIDALTDVDCSATIAKIPQYIGYASRKDSKITHEEALEKSSLVEATEKGKQIIDLVMKIDEICSMNGKDPLFKPTQKMIFVGWCLGTVSCSSEEEFMDVCDSLYFLFYENLERIKKIVTDNGVRTDRVYDFIFDVKNFRSHYRHDLEHGKAQDIKKKQIDIGNSFKKYCGKVPSASRDFMKLQIGLYDKIIEMEDKLITQIENAFIVGESEHEMKE